MSDKSKKTSTVTIRHTLTSTYRLLKANPLLKYQLKGQAIPESGNCSLLKVEFKDKVPQKILTKISSTNSPPVQKDKKPTLLKSQSIRYVPKNPVEQSAKGTVPKITTKTNNNNTKNVEVTKRPLRKVVFNEKLEQRKRMEFKTPSVHKKSTSVLSTPNNRLAKTSFTATPLPSQYTLEKRLNDWLKKHGKPIKTYSNLKHFNIKHDTITKNEENKENIEIVDEVKKDDSYEELGIVKAPQIVVEEVKKDLDVVARDALKDLKHLILEGYPREQCETWLSAIRQKYKDLEEEPTYWECLAALEETVGHISNAVNYYRNAIVQGAEVKDVDASLEHMLEKFSLFNINTNEKKQNGTEKPQYDRNKVVLAARNVFKSSIIQFAVEERKQKKGKDVLCITEEKKGLLVTPVRRSTRRRTGYIETPNVQYYSSVEKVKENNDADVEFRANPNLATKFF